MRKAFTMIELIFVIAIIGILSAVGISKMVGSRDDAHASVCGVQASNVLQEISFYYAKNGYFDAIKHMTNISVGVGSSKDGIKENENTILSTTTPITYVCNGEDVVIYKPVFVSEADSQGVMKYKVGIVTSKPTSAPVSLTAKIMVSDAEKRNFYKESPGHIITLN